MTFEILETETNGTIIKVIGVGGAGGNAVEHMINRGVQGVEFICANTDHQALARAQASNVIQLGKSGLGAGSRPEAGQAAASEARERLADALRGAHMVFITAGMGGGTGTGAAPVVAEVAQELGILTVAVVSKPFTFEGPRRMKIAEAGLDQLESKVHSLIVILNDKLEEVLGEDAEMHECFKAADDVLHNACAGIAEIINVPGLINVDFEDVKTVMSEHGKAMMGTASAEGLDRARIAAEQAVASPLLEGVDLSGARGVLVNITASSSLKMKETREVMDTIRAFAADDATVIFGTVRDESMGDELRVTVVATGLGRASSAKKLATPFTVVNAAPQLRTGTDNVVISAPAAAAPAAAPTAPAAAPSGDYGAFETPAVWRSRGEAQQRVQQMEESGTDRYDIPAFLRKQAD